MVDDKKLDSLKKDAERLLQRLPDDHPPIVIEFAGSPKAGKSTTIEIIAHFLKRSGYKVWAPTEGASKRTPYHLKRDLVAFNTWTLNYAISELLVSYFNVDHHNLVILDRGPYDSLAWMRVLQERGELGDEEFKVVHDFAVNTRWSKLITRVYLFKCDPDTSLKREHEHKLTRLPGTAMNRAMLSALLDHYGQVEDELPRDVVKVIRTSDATTPLETSFEIAQDVLEMFRAVAPSPQ